MPPKPKAGKPSERPRTDFGKRLLKARQRKGLSQASVAEHLGIDQSTYAKWERLDVALRPSQIERLMEILSIQADDLFGHRPKSTA